MLTDKALKALQPKDKPYRVSDAHGLYIEVSKAGTKAWHLKYRFGGKEKRLSIGKYPYVGVSEARKRANAAKQLLSDGIDPKADREQQAQQQALEQTLFKGVADAWYKKMQPQWAPATEKKRKALLNNDILPLLASMPIQDIRTPHIVNVLDYIVNRGAVETAKNAKQVLSQIMGYAKQIGLVEHNPATDLNNVLPKSNAKHRAAITDPARFGALLVDIDAYKCKSLSVKTALALAPLLFQRPGELCSMEWSELDFAKGQWVIPKEKKKERNQSEGDHIVPLSEQALMLLETIKPFTGHRQYVFQNQRNYDRHITTESLNKALRAMNYDTKTVQCTHGFRASARTMLDEQLKIRVEWIEQQLAHNVKDMNGRAYNRTRYLPERAQMMQQWANYLDALKKQHLGGNIITATFNR